jgi:hypothetical protein
MKRKDNYLTESILTLFERLEYYKGSLFHLANDIEKYTLSLIKNAKDKDVKFLKGSRLVISDFTGETDNGWEINFTLPTAGYLVNTENYKERNTQLFQVVSSTIVAQSYEALVTFIKEILTFYFENNTQVAFETVGKANCIWNRNKVNWRETVRKIDTGVNYNGLLKIIRILSPEFKRAEKNNNTNIDLSSWFDMVSVVRHSIVHSESIIKNNEFNKLNKSKQEILSSFFEVELHSGGSRKLLISKKHATYVIKFMCEYAFQVFKFLSISRELDWNILKK